MFEAALVHNGKCEGNPSAEERTHKANMATLLLRQKTRGKKLLETEVVVPSLLVLNGAKVLQSDFSESLLVCRSRGLAALLHSRAETVEISGLQ